MKKFRQSWRWYGPEDPVSLSDAKQAGATEIVTALHHIPMGEVWPVREIEKRKAEIEKAGLIWDVVESVPVHEDIKTRTGKYQTYISAYKESIQNLGKVGVGILTYNFMPVVDWTRTDLNFQLADGSKALRFDATAMIAFDAYILKRKEATDDYTTQQLENAENYLSGLRPDQKETLIRNITAGLPGSMAAKTNSLDSFKALLQNYKGIDRSMLQEHLLLFLDDIVPVAEESGVRLAIHPDDPPFSLFGLPRVVSKEEDVRAIYDRIDSVSNGLCFCTGSFGVSPTNDLVSMLKEFGSRINFIHLRATSREKDGSFYEAQHLDGDVDMYAVVKELVNIQKTRNESLPMRPDHGHVILSDLNIKTNPGYSGIGRLKGLAELRGLELGIIHSMQ
jgi:mannonate dehydratase